MKKKISIFMAVIFILTAIAPISTNAISPRSEVLAPGLSFTGTTAHCELTVGCDYLTDYITATIKLWNGSSCVATWYETAEGYMNFYATRTVSLNTTYKLTADVTINGTAYPQVSITKTS